MFQATGCEADFNFDDKQYYPMQHNDTLVEMYQQHATQIGLEFNLQHDTHDPYDLHTG